MKILKEVSNLFNRDTNWIESFFSFSGFDKNIGVFLSSYSSCAKRKFFSKGLITDKFTNTYFRNVYDENRNFHLSRKINCLFCALDSFVKRRNLIVKQSNYYILHEIYCTQMIMYIYYLIYTIIVY